MIRKFHKMIRIKIRITIRALQNDSNQLAGKLESSPSGGERRKHKIDKEKYEVLSDILFLSCFSVSQAFPVSFVD